MDIHSDKKTDIKALEDTLKAIFYTFIQTMNVWGSWRKKKGMSNKDYVKC